MRKYRIREEKGNFYPQKPKFFGYEDFEQSWGDAILLTCFKTLEEAQKFLEKQHSEQTSKLVKYHEYIIK